MKKPVFYTEIAYFVGMALLAFGTALTTFGDFGISMVVAPAYILHLKISETLSFFSFGMAEYVLQAIVLLLMMLLLRRVRGRYFLSIAAAVLYGMLLDFSMTVVGWITATDLWLRLVVYVGGVGMCTAGIALLFYSYLPPEAYELFVKEVAGKLGMQMTTFKTVYDCTSLVIAAIMSLLFFGQLRGIGVGTVVCALIYGVLIRLFGKLFDKCFVFRDCFAVRDKFTEKETVQ